MKNYIFIALMFVGSAVYSQTNASETKIDQYINYVITKGLDGDALMKMPQNFVYLYAIAIQLDSKGKIDTAYFSKNLNDQVKRTLNLNGGFVKRAKARNLTFGKYASQTVLIPFFHYRMTDQGINYNGGFLRDIENLVPVEVRDRKYVVLDFVVNPFHQTIN